MNKKKRKNIRGNGKRQRQSVAKCGRMVPHSSFNVIIAYHFIFIIYSFARSLIHPQFVIFFFSYRIIFGNNSIQYNYSIETPSTAHRTQPTNQWCRSNETRKINNWNMRNKEQNDMKILNETKNETNSQIKIKGNLSNGSNGIGHRSVVHHIDLTLILTLTITITLVAVAAFSIRLHCVCVCALVCAVNIWGNVHRLVWWVNEVYLMALYAFFFLFICSFIHSFSSSFFHLLSF